MPPSTVISRCSPLANRQQESVLLYNRLLLEYTARCSKEVSIGYHISRDTKVIHSLILNLCLAEVGTRNFFYESAITIPQVEGSTSSNTIPQLLKKCCSATATLQLQFFLKSETLNPPLESFTSAIFGIFLALESSWFMKKKLEVKISCNCPFKASFCFQRNRQLHKYFWLIFTILSWGKGTRK